MADHQEQLTQTAILPASASRAYELFLVGNPVPRIAEILSLPESTIRRYIDDRLAGAADSLSDDRLNKPETHVLFLQNLFRIALEEFAVSRKKKRRTKRKKTITKKEGLGSDGFSDESSSIVEEEKHEEDEALEDSTAGDPRYLEIALKCNEQIRKVLGVDPPIRILKAVATYAADNLKDKSDADLERIITEAIEHTPPMQQ